MKKTLRIISLVIVACLLTGCGQLDRLQEFFQTLSPTESQRYALLTYVHPDMEKHEEALSYACSVAKTERDIDKVVDAIYAYYDAYDLIYAAYDISYLHYCADLTDTYWAEEYAYCEEIISTVDDGLEKLYSALAASPLRSELESSFFGEDFFDAYEAYEAPDPALEALFTRESELLLRYYELYSESGDLEMYTPQWYDTYEPQLGQILVDLISVRQQLAAYYGYDSYSAFCYEAYHGRDYTPEQAETYLLSIRDQLSGIYTQLTESDIWSIGWETCDEDAAFTYVKTCAKAMGGDFQEAFSYLEENDLYDVSYSDNKYPTSFEVYILYYYVPYVYMCPEGTVYDKLSFAHEFGHFTADYVCGGSYVGTDVSEVLSQSMEYLSLFYANVSTDLQKLKLADSLSTYVDQAAYALFEQRMYALEGSELTTENLQALYGQTCAEFGFDPEIWDPRDYITIPHFYSQPLYIISYVVSNDLAMQLYQLEASKSGAGLDILQEAIYSEESYILTFAEDLGLLSPFSPKRIEALKRTFSTLLE